MKNIKTRLILIFTIVIFLVTGGLGLAIRKNLRNWLSSLKYKIR